MSVARRALPACFLFLTGLLLFPSAGRDDAHIMYWSAHALTNFGEMLNYNGDRVEQSSSLLFVLLLSIAHALSRIDLVFLGRGLSVACGIATVLVAHRLGDRIRPGAGFATSLLCSSAVYFVYWSFGGLESSLAALTAVVMILTWGSYLNAPGQRALALAALATASVALVRPEMPVVMLCMLLGSACLLLARRLTAKGGALNEDRGMLVRLGVLAGISAGLCLVVFVFRLVYFDSLFPQPVAAKSAEITLQRVSNGLLYLIAGTHPENIGAATTHWLLRGFIAVPVVIGSLGALRAGWQEFTGERVNPYAMLSSVFLAAYFGFIVLVEGDWMEGGRMIAHAIPVAVAFVACLLLRYFESSVVRGVVLLLLFASQTFVVLEFAATRSVGMPLWTGVAQVEHFALAYGAEDYSYFDRTNRDHLRNIPTLHQLDRIVAQLLRGDREKVHIMAHQMGVMPYYLAQKYFRRVQFFDVNGLTDRVTTEAPVFASVNRSTVGTRGVLVKFIQHRGEVEADPNFVVPDLFVYQYYDNYRLPAAVFDQMGFVVVYDQTGEISSGSRHFPGWEMWANQLIAVRRDLLVELSELPTARLEIRNAGIVQPGTGW
jgi:hypothetical protein